IGHEVRRFTADAVRRAESRQCESFSGMDGQRPEKLREFVNRRVLRAQFAPAVPYHQRSGQQELVFGPRRDTHGAYRMSVRRGGGVPSASRGAYGKLVGSRCQWGLSPSVMVDGKLCLPLNVCKEGA